MQETIIDIQNLTKFYETKCAVDDLNLKIYRGEVFGLLGPNGAGKSTSILMMLGLSEPSTGTITVCGYNSTHEPIKVKQKVGYLPDNVGFYEERTGLENLLYTAQLNGQSKQEAKERAIDLLRQVGLEKACHKKTGNYSRGMKQRLGLADVLIKQPEVIILDEPTLGIDPQGVQDLLSLIRTLSKEYGITVLLSSHHLHQVQQICDRVGLFVDGKLLACGNIKELAHKLFSSDGMTLETKVSLITDPLLEKLRDIPEVLAVEYKHDELTIKSKTDISSEVASIIVNSGISLRGLVLKEHGLDDIYHQYFEGEVNGKI
ncbi:ABC transporter ATP-binding protein [Bacillus sp. Marseille-P3661]|uniref:ABC transporter ATP-binding protein n=1 Tax=Bacillus sp. Marseille-P3661 TaxID=1936234 RepID=UPI000C854581|nr:ABC transporter ATP-binding protein [Bacillus sp. Marseille-P3661]